MGLGSGIRKIFDVQLQIRKGLDANNAVFISVPDPDPPDPNDFGPPRSGYISQRYGSGSESFY
jgi:hypothetical protein